MWPVTGIFISSKVAVRIKVPESAEFFSYPLFSTRLGNRSKMQCTCTHIFRAPLAQLRRRLLPRSAPEPCQTRWKKQLHARSERELFFGLHIFPIMGGSTQEPKTKRQKKEHVRRVQHIGVQGPYRKSRWSHICNTRVFASC